MRKYVGLGIMICMILVLAACGEKTKEDVVAKLDESLEKMSGYQAQATMSLETGEQSQSFDIDIAHKKKAYYRVLLKNEKDEEGSQIILKNDDGVFVLTPALNKSFKFQSDWPNNSSQPYLYQSLVKDVKSDTEAKFNATDDHFVFETKTNYQNNNNLPYQEIYFDKKTYTPVMVKVLDKDRNPLVVVEFTKFDLNPEFADDMFEIEKNMTSSLFGVPVMANEEEMNTDLTVLYPTESLGSELAEEKLKDTENGKRVMLSYQGEKNFTIIQEKANAYPTSVANPQSVVGEPVSLGFTMGALKASALEWSYNGVDYYLASEELTKDEMIEVASSVVGQSVK
ncbi:outer membrane lipoprotein carrier protein LolA [Aquibacillus koreensis]|uniref:Outer membrane lipoprotein carrier protein LolA n=1 Tax=Aquibacillus koreensis TaxID=279446 RepID=A0A9X3WLV6_9BACI|nr:outer membrane lipoprotein carrier protein LolA [Aquibacillus koreensis]MCT2534959.1 outer membrane lipoprotein carrier protein LolA [Aquibacillus koreensis]MDC3422147.1 outer membrane lipoprotein carrier protein LolA [Aquibacillus koreensis]